MGVLITLFLDREVVSDRKSNGFPELRELGRVDVAVLLVAGGRAIDCSLCSFFFFLKCPEKLKAECPDEMLVFDVRGGLEVGRVMAFIESGLTSGIDDEEWTREARRWV